MHPKKVQHILDVYIRLGRVGVNSPHGITAAQLKYALETAEPGEKFSTTYQRAYRSARLSQRDAARSNSTPTPTKE